VQALTRFSGLVPVVLALSLGACASAPSAPEADPANAVEAFDESVYEGLFLAPGADFSPYRRLMVPELEIEAALSVELSEPGYDPAGLGMTESDRRFYRQLYSELAVHQLVAGGGYGMSIDPAEDVLLVVSRITQVPPPPRSANAESAADTMGSLTISIELYDSTSNRLLGILTDRRAFGRSGEANNRSLTHNHARQIFYYWMEMLHKELDRLTGA
jgi:hypothetical protein